MQTPTFLCFPSWAELVPASLRLLWTGDPYTAPHLCLYLAIQFSLSSRNLSLSSCNLLQSLYNNDLDSMELTAQL